MFYKQVDVIPAPIAYIGKSQWVSPEISFVRDIDARRGIWVEIIVNMQAIHIVTLQDIRHYLTDIVTILLQRRIKQRQTVIFKTTLRMLTYHMIARIGMSHLGLCTVGINPGMQLHTTLVALFYHPCQRVPIGIRSHTLLPCQIIAPRLISALIQSIALSTNLKDDDVTSVFLQLVQLIAQRLLHGLFAHAHKLSVHTLYPGSAHFALLSPSCHRQHQGESHQ